MEYDYSASWIKAQLLHYGVSLSIDAIEQIHLHKYLKKRRAYSNYDEECFLDIDVPPEIFFADSKYPVSAIYKQKSPWIIAYENNKYYLKSVLFPGYLKEVYFLEEPSFYGKRLSNGEFAESYVSKLFGHTLGIFASTSCQFADRNNVCKFCSIKANQGRPSDMCKRVNAQMVLEAVELALRSDGDIDDIFISGGVISNDFDINFQWYCNLAKTIKGKIKELGKKVEITLNTYPPLNLELIDCLRGTGIATMISIELLDDSLRERICPGKSVLFNSIGVKSILEKFVNVVGYGKVLAFVIEGLEDEETIIQGVEEYGKIGVCIIVHVLHVDPGTWVAENNFCPPSPDTILKTAKRVSKIYHDHKLDTSILYGGRSSLDAEASGERLI